MRSGPLVTVVTPCLNPGERLARCLKSVARQTYPNVEHLVMDGGSDDGTVELLGASEVAWWSEPDSGQSQAINRGFAKAQGEILTWLNADDLLLPDAVEKVVAEFERRPSVAFVAGTARLVGEGEDGFAVPPTDLTVESMDLHTPIAQPACFFTAEAWKECGPLDEDLHLAMDLDLWYRFVLQGLAYSRIDAVLAQIEFHSAAKTQAVHRAQWESEYADVREQHGRRRAAAINRGRLAVRQSASSSPQYLQEVLSSQLSTKEERAGARLEAFAVSSGVGRFRHLAHPDVWKTPETRRHVLRTVVRRVRVERSANT